MDIKDFLKKYKWSVVLISAIIILNIYDGSIGAKANEITLSNFLSMFSILPPILLLIGLLDVWVPKEVMIKYMGEHAGVKGILIAFLLGSFAAGPLYAAFPIAAILLKKNAKISYVLFFLGVWSSAKLPMVMFEYTSFGAKFTIIHIMSNLIIFFIGAIMVEKLLSKDNKDELYKLATELSK